MRHFCKLAIAAIGLSGVSCASVRTSDTVLRLPIRFHLLSSSVSAALSTTRTDHDVDRLLAIANNIWQQAGIQWYAESVVHEQSPAGAAFDSLLAGRVRRTEARLTSFAPREHLLAAGWNVFLIRDFAQIAGGMFRPEITGIVLAEHGMGIDLPADGRGGATLAHELGHSLGLPHVSCDEARDIMANGCWSPTGHSTLTNTQIASARAQAMKGRPVSVIPEP